MYSYTIAPSLPNSMGGGGYFLAYKKLVSSFFSPPFTYKQNNHKTTNIFTNYANFYHNNINHFNTRISVCLFEYSQRNLKGLILILKIVILSPAYRTLDEEPIPLKTLRVIQGIKRLSGWRGSPHSNVAYTGARLSAFAERHPEPAPRSLRRRISPVQIKGE